MGHTWPNRGLVERRGLVQGIEAARGATAHYDRPGRPDHRRRRVRRRRRLEPAPRPASRSSAWSRATGSIRSPCRTGSADWELRRLTDFNADPNVRRRPEDYPVNDAASAFSPLMFNAVGGSTIHWSAHFPRYHPSDFRVRSLDGVGDDWPLTYDELEPFYDLNDRMIGVAGRDRRSRRSRRARRARRRRSRSAPLGETMARGFDKLGWHWWPSDARDHHRGVRRPARPATTAGPCDLGCPTGARASADVTYWPLALRLGVELRTRCRVREITVDAHGRARGVLYYDRDGALQEQRAPLVVVAAQRRRHAAAAAQLALARASRTAWPTAADWSART